MPLETTAAAGLRAEGTVAPNLSVSNPAEIRSARYVMQRLQCRDLYDIWYLLGAAGVDAAETRRSFERKAEHRGLDPGSFAQRYEKRIESYEQRWEGELVSYMTPVPDIDRVVREVKRELRQANYL